MLSKYLAVAMIGSALLAAPALAQTAPATSAQSATAAGMWQGSKLIGVNVYNNQNEKIGDIKDLMLSKNGNVETVVIGVGGFLGMGERDVAVKFSELKWSDQPVGNTSASTTTTTTTTTTRPVTTGANAVTPASTKKTYPDHAMLNATKDQLKAMPQFDYNK